MRAELMVLVDGRFPAGGHTNSAGVEAAVRLGDVHDVATLERYLAGRLATTGVVEAAFAAHVAGIVDPTTAQLDAVAAELSARIASPALRDASRRFGRQLLRAGSAIWRSPAVDALATSADDPHQPVVLGALVAAAGGSPRDAASIALHHLGAAVATSAVRLLGLDPMDVAGAQARAAGRIDDWAAHAEGWAATTPSRLPADGGTLTEILAQDHAGWDARLFVA